MYKSNFKLHYPLLVTAVVIGSSAIASPSSLTPAVIGHKPTVDNILLDKTAPVLGDTLNVTYDYQDIDGDADASTIKWLYNGIEVAGQTAKQYTPVLISILVWAMPVVIFKSRQRLPRNPTPVTLNSAQPKPVRLLALL